MGEQMYSGGVRRFQREGASPQEKNAELESKPFNEKVLELLEVKAPELVLHMKFGQTVEEVLKEHAANEITEEFCDQFIQTHPEFSDFNPALVRATALRLSAEKKKETLH